MQKKIVLIWIMALPFALIGCGKKDQQYYRMNPAEIQKARENCSRSSRSISCKALMEVQERVNALVESLSRDPQGFGKEILALQEEIVKQNKVLQIHPQNSQLVAEQKANQEKLLEYLAIVKWQEAPEH